MLKSYLIADFFTDEIPLIFPHFLLIYRQHSALTITGGHLGFKCAESHRKNGRGTVLVNWVPETLPFGQHPTPKIPAAREKTSATQGTV